MADPLNLPPYRRIWMRHPDPEHLNQCEPGRECLLQEFKLLSGGLPNARGDARHIAPGTAEAPREPGLDRIRHRIEDDGDNPCRHACRCGGFVAPSHDHVHLRPDELRCEEAASQGPYERPAVHYSITWSARCRSDGGIVRPRALAVLRLMTSSNFRGKRPGHSPDTRKHHSSHSVGELAFLDEAPACALRRAPVVARTGDAEDVADHHIVIRRNVLPQLAQEIVLLDAAWPDERADVVPVRAVPRHHRPIPTEADDVAVLAQLDEIK